MGLNKKIKIGCIEVGLWALVVCLRLLGVFYFAMFAILRTIQFELWRRYASLCQKATKKI